MARNDATPLERFLAPLLVLGLHGVLLLDVVWHRPELTRLDGGAVVVKWASVVLAVFAYLCTVLSPPGFLKGKDPASKPPVPWAAARLVLGPFLLLLGRACFAVGGWRLLQGLQRRLRADSQQQERELQPIKLGRLEDEEDPGEEIIDPQDLGRSGVDGLDEARRDGPGPGLAAGEATHTLELDGMATGSGISASSSSAAAALRRPQLRFCKVCQAHQPLRTKHCRECGRCVRTHDHHCPWIGTCVAEGNRVSFYWFLGTEAVELLIFTREGFLAIHEKHGWNVAAWLDKMPLLVFGVFVMSLLLFMVSCLWCLHSYLAMSNITTWESMAWYHISYLKHFSPKGGSPFSLGLRANLGVYCCPPWCLPGSTDAAPEFKRTPEGWVVWELEKQAWPSVLDFGPCGCGGRGCLLCPCFDARGEM